MTTSIPPIPANSINSIVVANGGGGWTTSSGLHNHTLYSGGGMSGAHGSMGPQGVQSVPSFIPMFDKAQDKYIDVPYWEFHKVYEDHLVLKRLSEEFPAVKQALDNLKTITKLHRED